MGSPNGYGSKRVPGDDQMINFPNRLFLITLLRMYVKNSDTTAR